MMQRLGLDVHVIDRPWGEGAHEGILEEVLRKVCVKDEETFEG